MVRTEVMDTVMATATTITGMMTIMGTATKRIMGTITGSHEAKVTTDMLTRITAIATRKTMATVTRWKMRLAAVATTMRNLRQKRSDSLALP
jgi:hypothetical protein